MIDSSFFHNFPWMKLLQSLRAQALRQAAGVLTLAQCLDSYKTLDHQFPSKGEFAPNDICYAWRQVWLL